MRITIILKKKSCFLFLFLYKKKKKREKKKKKKGVKNSEFVNKKIKEVFEKKLY